jgi:RNA polymerase sigma factor (sigma-70 family)
MTSSLRGGIASGQDSAQERRHAVIHLSWYCLKTPTLMSFDNSEWSGRRVDLLRFVRRRIDDAALREDIVQEAIIRLLAYQAKPGITIANITGLLRRISLDLTRDHVRRSARIRQVELSDEIPCPHPSIQQSLEQRQLIEIVAGVLKAMPRLRRTVFLRRRVEGQSAKEVAEALGISPGAVDAHMARAVLDLYRSTEKIEASIASARK